MNKDMLLASAALFAIAVATPAFADNLNPQPEPPGVHKLQTGNQMGAMGQTAVQDSSHNCSAKTSTIGSATGGAGAGKTCAGGMHMMRKAGGSPGGNAMLNPQPLPPKSNSTMMKNGQSVMLNPQPLPPGPPDKQHALINAHTSAAATHGFNPQPDPPGAPQTQTQTQQ